MPSTSTVDWSKATYTTLLSLAEKLAITIVIHLGALVYTAQVLALDLKSTGIAASCLFRALPSALTRMPFHVVIIFAMEAASE